MFTKTWFENHGIYTGKIAAWWSSRWIGLMIAFVSLGIIGASWNYTIRPLFNWACTSVDSALFGGHTVFCRLGEWIGIGAEGLGRGLESVIPATAGDGGTYTELDIFITQYDLPVPQQIKLLAGNTSVYTNPNGALAGVWTKELNGETVTVVAIADTDGVKWVKIPWTTSFGWALAKDFDQTALPAIETLQQTSVEKVGPWDEIPEYLLSTGPIVKSGTYAGLTTVNAWDDLRMKPEIVVNNETLPVFQAMAQMPKNWGDFSLFYLHAFS